MAGWKRRFVGLACLPLLIGCHHAYGPAREDPPKFRYMMRTYAHFTEAAKTVRFVDVANTTGIHYQWTIEGKRPLNILQTIGNGCAFLDYDNDGNLDLLLVGPKLALYKGDGKGHFTDVTAAAGLEKFSGRFLGCAVGDVDGDGYDDVYISGYREALLLHNEGGRTFRDITQEAGLKPQPWGTSCAFAETVPGSGRLDLYMANYADFSLDVGPLLCMQHDVETSCGPKQYKPLPGVLYQNDGHGHFTDITQASGAAAVQGRGLGVAFADYDGSGRPSLALANDELPGDLLRPDPHGPQVRYTNLGESSGTAYDREGNTHGGMGLDWGDYDNDGKFDLLVATFQGEPRSLYHNDGQGQFSDRGFQMGIGSAGVPYVAFGCKFFDYDNDGRLDIILANGHVQDNIHEVDHLSTYRQPTQLFHNRSGKYPGYEEADQTSPDLMRPIVGRGLAVGDYDNDGRVDVLIVDSEGRPLLLHNECSATGHWLGVRLVGTKSNRDGYGAVLTAKIGKRALIQQCQTCGSYLSASDRRVHFGLDRAKRVDVLTVRWPSGHTDTYKNLTADRYIALREGDPAVKSESAPPAPVAAR
ncbi:MAG TPA: CRTAC1 family protein [Chthonomonadaceae bacterium]|nr:CRTAC1 family protein [Chthonomonadaceae bacterium]